MDNSQGCMRGLIMLMDISVGMSDDLLQIIDFNYRQDQVNISVRHVWRHVFKYTNSLIKPILIMTVAPTQGIS